jgi:hypothetical protein
MALLSEPTDAGIRHRYSFTSDASDSVSGAHGTVIDPGTMPNHHFGGGMIDLSANTGEPSSQITEDSYIDLPNGIVSAAAGANAAITFEFWATVAESHSWQRFGDFGTSPGGEDVSTDASLSQYIWITPNSNRFNLGLEISTHPSTGSGLAHVGETGPFPTGVETHVVAVFDHADSSGGANPNGTMFLYRDGGLIGSEAIHPDFDLRNPIDNNNWLGRSQWPDPVFDGSYNEFRIYDTALSAQQVATSFRNGPDGVIVPEPASLLIVVAAGSLLAVLRRKRL